MNTIDIATEIKNSSTMLHKLTERESDELKNCLIEMLKDLLVVCQKHQINYCLAGGSALGAVRHKGFIPWDDDLDLFMPRKDCEKLIEVFEGELSEKYVLQAPNSNFDCTNNFIKIRKKGTELVEMDTISMQSFKGIYIDIFPLDYAPNNRFLAKVKGSLIDLIAIIGVSEFMWRNKNDIVCSFYELSKSGKKYYSVRLLLGKMASFASYKKWYNLFDNLSKGRESRYITVPAGRGHYMKERLPAKVFFPFVNGLFEEIPVYLPHDTDTYLRNLYGDYMTIPTEEKRERHYIVKINLDLEE